MDCDETLFTDTQWVDNAKNVIKRCYHDSETMVISYTSGYVAGAAI